VNDDEEESSGMASSHDVAAAILERISPIDTYKLQKLAYYCQAWHLVWEGKPLFEDRIEAWAAGPVVRSLFSKHRGRFRVSEWPGGDPSALSPAEMSTIDAVVSSYGRLSGAQLSTLTHREPPWRNARRGIAPGAPSSTEITPTAMYEYYAQLDGDEEAPAVESLLAE
jgi:uncharacterized phage-associated protein